MKKSIWIFLFAVLLPGVVLGWLALHSADEQQIVFERRTAELYQKETEGLAASVRDAVDGERRAFGDTVHRLLARSDAEALARDFTNSLMDSWPRKAIGFVLGPDGQMLSPNTTMAAKDPEMRTFIWNNGSFLCSTQPAVVYPVPLETNTKSFGYGQLNRGRAAYNTEGKPALSVWDGSSPTVLAQKNGSQVEGQQYLKVPVPEKVPEDKTKADSLDRAGVMRSAQAAVQTAQVAEQPGRPENVAPVTAAAPAAPAAAAQESSLALSSASGGMAGQSLATGVAKNGAPKMAQPPALSGPGRRGREEGLALAVPPLPAPAPMPTAPIVAAPMAAAKAPAMKPVDERVGAKSEEPKELAKLEAKPVDPDQLAETLRVQKPLGKAMQSPEPSQDALRGDTKDLPDAAKSAPRPTAQKKAKAVADKESESTMRKRSVTAEAKLETPQQQIVQQEQVPQEAAVQAQGAFATGAEIVANANPAQNAFLANRAGNELYNRMVEPQQQIRAVTSNWSSVLPSTSDFRALTAGNDEGMLARFVQDKLDLIFWIRPPEAPEMVFGCLVEAADMGPMWADLFTNRVADPRVELPPFVLALLDDKARPIATFPPVNNIREWKRPFVADEIGEVLPHWEAALYLATPTAIADLSRGLRRTLSFTVVGAIALIAIGGWLVVADVRRQLALAQQKTDFVSNVSHELKTPLTSIRMFAELMHDRPPPAEKQGQYLRIIRVEAERLTRLINNVLDFAKLERRQRRFDKKHLDLCEVITGVWEGQEMHLRDGGFKTNWEAAPGPYPVLGDEDALAQILVNLLSNAEKYSSERKEVDLVTWIENGWINASVLDRGMGVPDGEEKKIFEAFYRAHDSLSSGIQGSGLGLTLAQRLAAEQGGEILFERRQDGGSRFTLRMPLMNGNHDEFSEIAPA